MQIKISPGNIKMGNIPSVSLPAVVTCRECACNNKCYGRRIERRRPSVHKAYQNNLRILQTEPDVYWREVEATIMLSRFFRFHVSGDIPDVAYFYRMVEVAKRQPHCQLLCFTKKYDIVNDFLAAGRILPANLHIVFSGWVGLDMVNPFALPEAHVKYSDGSTTANNDAIPCSGNCAQCATTDGGCWSLQNGQQVVFNEH